MNRRSKLKETLASIGEYLVYVAIVVSFAFSLFAIPLLIGALIAPIHVVVFKLPQNFTVTETYGKIIYCAINKPYGTPLTVNMLQHVNQTKLIQCVNQIMNTTSLSALRVTWVTDMSEINGKYYEVKTQAIQLYVNGRWVTISGSDIKPNYVIQYEECNITHTLMQFLAISAIITSPLTLAPIMIAVEDELKNRKKNKTKPKH